MKKKNVLVFMTDQQRGDTVIDGMAIRPNIDKFKKDSITFRETYCPSPHCCPSRASFFTGLYPSQHGVWNNINVANTLSRGMYFDVKMFTDVLKESGYDLYFSGKWHISEYERPEDRGFICSNSSFRKIPFEHNRRDFTKDFEWQQYEEGLWKDKETREDMEILRPGYGKYDICYLNEKPFNDDKVVDDAIDFIKNRDTEKPFFQYVGTLGPHDPYNPPERFLDLYKNIEITLPDNFNDLMDDKPSLYKRTKSVYDQLTKEEHIEAIRHYLAFVTYEDYLFGKVIDALKVNGQYDDTIIIYTSDHGDYMAEHGIWAKGLPCFKSGYHIPYIMKLPKPYLSMELDGYVSICDIGSTLLDLLDLDTSYNNGIVGKSLKDEIKRCQDEKDTRVNIRDFLVTQTNGNELYGIQRSIMDRKYKYVYNGFDFDELYDLEKDPGELNNLVNENSYGKHLDVVKDMSIKMWKFLYDVNESSINSYVMVGLAPFGPGIIFNGDKNNEKKT